MFLTSLLPKKYSFSRNELYICAGPSSEGKRLFCKTKYRAINAKNKYGYNFFAYSTTLNILELLFNFSSVYKLTIHDELQLNSFQNYLSKVY